MGPCSTTGTCANLLDPINTNGTDCRGWLHPLPPQGLAPPHWLRGHQVTPWDVTPELPLSSSAHLEVTPHPRGSFLLCGPKDRPLCAPSIEGPSRPLRTESSVTPRALGVLQGSLMMELRVTPLWGPLEPHKDGPPPSLHTQVSVQPPPRTALAWAWGPPTIQSRFRGSPLFSSG